jgi:hypothetical protein
MPTLPTWPTKMPQPISVIMQIQIQTCDARYDRFSIRDLITR